MHRFVPWLICASKIVEKPNSKPLLVYKIQSNAPDSSNKVLSATSGELPNYVIPTEIDNLRNSNCSLTNPSASSSNIDCGADVPQTSKNSDAHMESKAMLIAKTQQESPSVPEIMIRNLAQTINASDEGKSHGWIRKRTRCKISEE